MNVDAFGCIHNLRFYEIFEPARINLSIGYRDLVVVSFLYPMPDPWKLVEHLLIAVLIAAIRHGLKTSINPY